MRFFRRKQVNTDINIELSGGLFLERPRNTEKQNSLFNCLPKGILCFLVVFGSLGGFISAFDIECNYILPAVILFLSAMYFSGLFAFAKERHKDIGYILFFIFYVLAIYLFEAYVNSGFSAMINEIKQHGEVYFGLNTGTEFAERIDDRYLTVTITFIFIGIFQIIVLNIFVSNYMSLKFAVYMALSMYVFPLYLREEPRLFFVLCMLCGFAGIYIFKNNGHFKDGKSRQGYEKTARSKVPEVAYTQHNKVYAGVLPAVLCCTLFVGMCTVFYDEFQFQRSYTENRYKSATRDAVSGFLMLGFRSFDRNMYSRGGMSGGKLGDVVAIRPDNETDLVVRFTPFSGSPVYLKGYTGTIYGDNEWLSDQDLATWVVDLHSLYENDMQDEAVQLEQAYCAGKEKQSRAVLEVENRGADPSYVYYPYFTRFDDTQTDRFTFYPNIGYEADIRGEKPQHCDGVPIKNQDAVDRVIADIGVHTGDEDAVERVVEYLKENYSYSYYPGRLPEGGDVVNYFLDDNKKGVCYHFASAAVLIFRRLGISARYVEGYAFGVNSVMDGTVKEDLNYDDYYSGYSQLGRTAVMEVEVTDANAHAWVEIYKEGKGWMVVDPTPTVIEDGGGGDFWRDFTNFWQDTPGLELTGDLSALNLSFLNSGEMRLALVVLFGLAVFILAARLGIRQILNWRGWHTGDLAQNLLWYYRNICRRRARHDEAFRKLSVPSEQLAYLLRECGTMDQDRVIRCFEKICFCPAEPEKEEYDYVIGALKKMKRRRR